VITATANSCRDGPIIKDTTQEQDVTAGAPAELVGRSAAGIGD